MKHRPKVRKQARYGGEGPGFDYRLECTCGHRTDWTPIPGASEQAKTEHLEAVAVPEEDRCRDPKTHKTRWWEFCPVCAYQLALPGFEEITA
ncbi:hypothetical protein [Nocardiopsis kunsanensis]|uniref:hypothetical protein n=1 Tax=Nocardiopsis kunsanensis TaxID=141693 RepID=UPI00034CCE73|nr:hypothetical protein [Nocardiopsis kunsanensis]